MSIINDALKKVQQRLNPSNDQSPEETPPAQAPALSPSYIFAPPTADKNTLTETIEKPPSSKTNKLKNRFVNVCAIMISSAITLACLQYIYHQFRNDVPKVENLAQSSISKLMSLSPLSKQKQPPPPPPSLGSLAQLTVEAPAATDLSPASPLPATRPTSAAAAPSSIPAKPPAPIVLNVNGIMANGTRNLVLIDNQVYEEGDEVDGIKIIKIDINSITVINNGKEETIYVKS